MTKFITVTTKDVSQYTGQPKLFAINIAHIVTVEPAIFDIPEGMDKATSIEGTSIVVNVNANHVIEVATRDPFEHVLKRIQLADGVIQISDPERETKELGKLPGLEDLCHGFGFEGESNA